MFTKHETLPFHWTGSVGRCEESREHLAFQIAWLRSWQSEALGELCGESSQCPLLNWTHNFLEHCSISIFFNEWQIQVKGSRDAKMKHVLELEIRCHSSPEPARRFFFCHFFGAFELKFKKSPKVLGPMGLPKIFSLLKGCLKIFWPIRGIDFAGFWDPLVDGCVSLYRVYCRFCAEDLCCGLRHW